MVPHLPGVVMLEPVTGRSVWVLERDAAAYLERGYVPGDRPAEAVVGGLGEANAPPPPEPADGAGRRSGGLTLPRRMSGGNRRTTGS